MREVGPRVLALEVLEVQELLELLELVVERERQ